MHEQLNKIQQLPYYIQLKNILKEKIISGKLVSDKLPPIRKLAKEFGVSVNTVLRAYDELSKDGIVSGSVGRGTFITTSQKKIDTVNKKVFLTKIIELAVEEALSHEISLKEFEREVSQFIAAKLEMMQHIRLVFIECNIEQLIYFTNHLELDPQIHRIPILFDDLLKMTDTVVSEIKSCDIIVTSFYHLDDVKKQLGTIDKPIIGINLEPEVKTIVDVAKIPENSTVGIITTSKTFIEIIKGILSELNLHFTNLLESNSTQEPMISEIVAQCDAILVSPKRKNLVLSLASTHTKVIEFVFTPDRTSINNLKVALLEAKKHI